MKAWPFVVLFAVAFAKHEDYAGWKSYYVGPKTQEQFQVFQAAEGPLQLDVLSHPISERDGVVLVPPQSQEQFVQVLEEAGISFKVHAEDVKKALEIDDENIAKRRSTYHTRNGGRQMPYDNYQELDVIDEYVRDIARRFPDKVTLVTPANSFEGHPIQYLKISTTNFQDQSKPIIFIDGGIHSREWISPPTVTWAIHKLLEDVTEPELLENFDWIVLPVVNPDGYKHTFSSRFWRKTRSTNTNSLSGVCPGVDGNRNYDFAWNTVGTSNSPCADTYAGNVAFSEIETRVVRDILQENLQRIALYLTIHSYGSMILYPWGHDGTLSNNGLALHIVGTAMSDAIHSMKLPHFPNYVVGNSALVIQYAAAGASEDYAHSIGVPLSYTYELPGLAGGFNGFHLDPIYIEQVCQETWAGIVAGVRKTAEFNGIRM